MIRIFLLIAITMMFAACATDGKPRKGSFASAACVGTATGYTHTRLRYGAAELKVRPLSDVREKSEFRIKLKPRKDYRGAKVTVTGTSGTKKNGDPADPTWINGSGVYNDLKAEKYKLVVGCVPDGVTEDTVYKFKVEVEKGDDINVLDPRAKVVN